MLPKTVVTEAYGDGDQEGVLMSVTVAEAVDAVIRIVVGESVVEEDEEEEEDEKGIGCGDGEFDDVVT